MQCPKCGNPIYSGDISCRKCHLPVANMSGIPSTYNTNVIYPTPSVPKVEEVPYIHPTDSMQPPPPKIERIKAPTEEKYKNYGVGKKPITSLKFILPVVLGSIVLIGIIFGLFQFIQTLMNDHKPNTEPDQSVTLEGISYQIPNTLEYRTNGNSLNLTDGNSEWKATITYLDSFYENLKVNPSILGSYFSMTGYIADTPKLETISTQEYMIAKGIKDNITVLLAISSLKNSSKTLMITIQRRDNTYDPDLLQEITSVIQSASYQGA